MNTTDLIFALGQRLETVTVTVAKCPQCGVVGEARVPGQARTVFIGDVFLDDTFVDRTKAGPRIIERNKRPLNLLPPNSYEFITHSIIRPLSGVSLSNDMYEMYERH